MGRKILKKTFVYIMILLVIFTMAGCSSKSQETTATSDAVQETSEPEMGMANSSEFLMDESKDSIEKQGLKKSSNKIIKSAYMEIETTDFDKTINAIISKTGGIGGYIENSNITGTRINNSGTLEKRNASFKLRIPKEGFESFKTQVGTLGNIITNSTQGVDISDQYFDTEARLSALKIQEERLLEILKKSVEIKDIIELERELSNIRYEIENLTGNIRKWDNLVDYSTIDIHVYEVQQITEGKEDPESLGEKVASGFNSSIKLLVEIFKGLIVVIAALIPFIIIIVPVLAFVLYILKRRNKKKNDNTKEN